MSVIQQIQEKYAKLMAIIIAIALIIFVIMLAFEGGGSLFRSGPTNLIGSVNGEDITYNAFQRKTEQQEAFMKTQGYPSGPALTRQAMDAVWTQEVNARLILSEADKLGLSISKRETGDILYGPNAPDDLKQQFTDKATGIYNGQQAKSQLDNMLKSGTADQKAQINAYISSLELNRLAEKYTSLLTNSINFPKWKIEKENADNSQLAKISFVREVYASIADSMVKVTDKEIEEYVTSHKDQYQQEESRSIDYVAFSAMPTATDSASTRNKLIELKPVFDSTGNEEEFLISQGAQNNYSGYINGPRIQVPSKDSIFKIPVGSVYGPYLDGGNYTLAKLIGTRTQPDTVNFRHILVATAQQDQQTGQMRMVRDTVEAKRLIDSLQTAIRNGSSFDTLVAKFSEDPGSKDKGGVYEKVAAGTMTPAFNDYIFGHPAGSKGIIKTEYGYHYIEVLSQKGSSPAYRIAYLSAPVLASQETDANASNMATQFAGDSRDRKSFDANADKLKAKGVNRFSESEITPNGYQLQTGVSRPFVKSIYAAKLGEVLQPERLGEFYVVGIVTGVNKKGTQSADKARAAVEPLLRNHKKADLIIKKAGNATTLEAVATAWGGKTIEMIDSMRFDATQTMLSNEPKVVGAAFNPANKGKVTPLIEGGSGVYMVRVENLTATSVMSLSIPEQRRQRYEQAKATRTDPTIVLKEAASIKDNRSKMY